MFVVDFDVAHVRWFPNILINISVVLLDTLIVVCVCVCASVYIRVFHDSVKLRGNSAHFYETNK